MGNTGDTDEEGSTQYNRRWQVLKAGKRDDGKAGRVVTSQRAAQGRPLEKRLRESYEGEEHSGKESAQARRAWGGTGQCGWSREVRGLRSLQP